MSKLKSLTLGTYAANSNDPVLYRRLKIVTRLEQQKALANDPNYVEVAYRWVKNGQGIKERIKLEKPVRRWWKIDPLGKVLLKLKYGSRTIELSSGKDAIVLDSPDQIPDTLDMLIEATKAGDMDAFLETGRDRFPLTKGKPKRISAQEKKKAR